MENKPKKLRLEDIKVESFVTSSFPNPYTIQGGATRIGCVEESDDQAFDCGGTGGVGSVPLGCGTNVPGGCSGFPCQSNTACPDVSCANLNVSWCCPSVNQASDCQTCATCATTCPCP
jgi:hypothetical protein